jgi:hypothetical protein
VLREKPMEPRGRQVLWETGEWQGHKITRSIGIVVAVAPTARVVSTAEGCVITGETAASVAAATTPVTASAVGIGRRRSVRAHER